MKKELTIGSATYDDFQGVFFTYQAIRLANLDILDRLDLVVIDNNPDSRDGKETKDFCKKAGIRYLEERERRSTAVRDRIFEEALAPWAMSIDPHVLFEPNTILQLLAWIFKESESEDLLHGPMLYDYLRDEVPATHMDPVWRDNMHGTWGHDPRGKDRSAESFEIPMHGLGLVVSKVETWPGFHPLFLGFGGEEGYVHEKKRQMGGTSKCLPFLRWLHRFQRPRGVEYPLIIEERIKNYLIGWSDLGKDLEEVIEHFNKTHPQVPVKEVLLPEVCALLNEYESNPEETAKAYHHKHRKIQRWTDTQVTLQQPLCIDVQGNPLMVKGLSLEWSTD
tara:strand:- start:394 stop:1398 length:1005 start_codon:yes stop_codon:yes gene_type:complete